MLCCQNWKIKHNRLRVGELFHMPFRAINNFFFFNVAITLLSKHEMHCFQKPFKLVL